MHIRLLGTAAGGGFPQWNCHCAGCTIARSHPEAAVPRTQSSVAVSADREHWFLLNASPDIRAQVATLPGPAPLGVRHVPFEAVVLSDAEIDHTMGLALVRESRELRIYSTAAIRDVLEGDSHILPIVRAFANVSVQPLSIGSRAELRLRSGQASGLSVECIPLSSHSPRFSHVSAPGVSCALIVRDDAGGSLVYAPSCAAIDATLREALATAGVVLFDGTFWTDRELIELGISDRTASAMGHMPVSGPEGSLMTLAGLTWCERIYVHINNTNPMLVEDSRERREVQASGVEVGYDGMELTC